MTHPTLTQRNPSYYAWLKREADKDDARRETIVPFAPVPDVRRPKVKWSVGLANLVRREIINFIQL